MKPVIFLLSALLSFFITRAQNTPSKKAQTLKQVLRMNEADYRVFARVMDSFQLRILIVHKDSAMAFAQKSAALSQLHQSRQAYLSTHLTARQQSAFAAYNHANERRSPAFLRHQAQLEKLRQKAIKSTGGS